MQPSVGVTPAFISLKNSGTSVYCSCDHHRMAGSLPDISDPKKEVQSIFERIILVDNSVVQNSSVQSSVGHLGFKFTQGPEPDMFYMDFKGTLSGRIRKLGCRDASTRDSIDRLIVDILNEKIEDLKSNEGRPCNLLGLLGFDSFQGPLDFKLQNCDKHFVNMIKWLKKVAVAPLCVRTSRQTKEGKKQWETLLNTRQVLFQKMDNDDDHSFLGRHRFEVFPTKKVPLGSSFQVDLPHWTDDVLRDGVSLVDPKWLGTKLWPLGHVVEPNMREMGKGRNASCSCYSKGSIKCVGYHIKMSRNRLLAELGEAFFTMGFDNMGEEVSRLWTLDEELAFEKNAKIKPSLNGNIGLYPPLSSLPSKRRVDFVSYYFNVYILRQMRTKTRLGHGDFNSDDDE